MLNFAAQKHYQKLLNVRFACPNCNPFINLRFFLCNLFYLEVIQIFYISGSLQKCTCVPYAYSYKPTFSDLAHTQIHILHYNLQITYQ
jgi:hypothetical protein